ncbi:ORF6C domain-containing protein [Clostridium cochlearium]|uniref:ORF6C domain-containing protein n=1 Tax=Clostridium cochlearium TaxID=1494 RepID=UPI00167A8292|nr:ORF6C domain-containing protein [Clostridium cochlearium]
MSNLTVLTKELIPVYQNEEGHRLVNARELHEWLGNKDNFTTWIGDRIKQYGFIENVDYTSFLENSKKPQGGRPSKEYVITLNMAKELSMVERTEKGKQARKYFIKCEEKLKEVVKDPYKGLSKELQAVFILDRKTQEIEDRVNDLEDNMPLFNVECKELQSLVRKIGTRTLGGYGSPAYKDNSLRGKVYADIQHQLKREFGVRRYEAIKRCQLDTAKEIVSNYKAPIVLQDEIISTNNQISFN